MLEAAARDVVGPAALRPDRLDPLDAGLVHVGARRQIVEHRAEHPIEQDIAGDVVTLAIAGHALLQQRLAAQAVAAGGRSGLAHVVRLHRAMGDQHVRTSLQRVADQKFQLPRLVAAGGEAGAVVPLDVEIGAAEQPGEIGHRLERGGQMGEMLAGKTGEMHRRRPFLGDIIRQLRSGALRIVH